MWLSLKSFHFKSKYKIYKFLNLERFSFISYRDSSAFIMVYDNLRVKFFKFGRHDKLFIKHYNPFYFMGFWCIFKENVCRLVNFYKDSAIFYTISELRLFFDKSKLNSDSYYSPIIS